MKQVNRIALVIGAFALGAVAQDAETISKMKADVDKMQAEVQAKLSQVMTFSFQGGVMGKQVKGAPYSADEVRETTQVLADGTRIQNQTATTVYRDGEGRVRRETPNEISIFDPVAGVSYSLDPKALTARKMPINMGVNRVIYKIADDGQTTVGMQALAAASDKADAEKRAVMFKAGFEAGQKAAGRAGVKEDLGTQVIEGVASQGTRTTMTIDANTIGNDRPIQVVNESWVSPDLQTTVMTKHNDPRTGEEVFRVTNIRRGEPGVSLFQPPANYQIVEPKVQSGQAVPTVRRELP